MLKNKTLHTLIFTWIAWLVILYGFQWLVTTRLGVKRPDYAVPWTKTETMPNSNFGKIYLLEPFLNRQVAWDSEYYLGIAVGGYDDPAAGVATDPDGKDWIINYSFFPAYPYLMRAFMLPLGLFGLNPIATAALAGVIVTLLGTLAAMIALWDMTRDYFDENDGLRAVFYMLIFPTSFFFAQVYTEGLFVGLAFGALALLKRKQWLWAAVLAFFAAWTRAHGVLLALPLGVAWLRAMDWKNFRASFSWKWLAQGAFALLPLIAYHIWRYSALGEGWAALQVFYFGRGVLSIENSINSWKDSFFYAFYKQKGEAAIYFSLEIFSVALTFISSLFLIKKHPEVALFSLAIVIFSALSGSAQSLARYMLVAPAMFIFLGMLGRNKVFDRAWTIISLLLMGMSVLLFSFDMWVG